MLDVVTIGSATRDGFFEGIDFISPRGDCFITGKGICLPLGTKIQVPQVYFLTGGGATNTAITFRRLGLKTATICRLGKDISGETITREQKAEGVNTQFIQVDRDIPTAYSVIFISSLGERTILSYKGCAEKLSFKEIPLKKLKTKWLYLGSLGKNKNILKKFIQYAVSQKIKLAINPGKQELIWLQRNLSWLHYFDVVICNQEEAAYFTGIPYKKEKQIFKRLDDLVQGIIVMTKGVKGVSVSNGKYIWQAGVYKKKKIKDMTGAGDAFASAFVSVLIRENKEDGKTIQEAIRVGSANAVSVIEHIGAKPGILFKKNLKKFSFQKLAIKKIKLKY